MAPTSGAAIPGRDSSHARATWAGFAPRAAATATLDALPPKRPRTYVEPSRYPSVERDLAVVVPLDVLAGNLAAAVRAEPLVRDATVFDEYRGPQIGAERKSLALRIVLQSREGTLTDEAADAALALPDDERLHTPSEGLADRLARRRPADARRLYEAAIAYWRLQGTSSWENLVTGRDRHVPSGWTGQRPGDLEPRA